jgi:uncharacterized protein
MAARQSTPSGAAQGSDLETILFRRHETPGHDACRLIVGTAERRIEGAAVFTWGGMATYLAYDVVTHQDWRARHARVCGWVGARSIDVAIEREASGDWLLNGAVVPGLKGCVDVDLGFTPATNLLQLRRIQLRIGEKAEVPVAWWDLDSQGLSLLKQSYERRNQHSYWYESPRFRYQALLEVAPSGFVLEYPGLWTVQSD